MSEQARIATETVRHLEGDKLALQKQLIDAQDLLIKRNSELIDRNAELMLAREHLARFQKETQGKGSGGWVVARTLDGCYRLAPLAGWRFELDDDGFVTYCRAG